MDDLVETSTNLGIVETTKEAVSFTSMVRSNKDSKREAVLNELDMWTKITSSTREINGAYPGWDIKEDSELQKIAVKAFEKVADMTPAVLGMHAGVECGILCEKIPGLDCISIGPTMTDVHSVNEKLSISSSAKMYQIVKEILRTCK
jgi:dipeptidase D